MAFVHAWSRCLSVSGFHKVAMTISPCSKAHVVRDRPKPEDASVTVFRGWKRKKLHPGKLHRTHQTKFAESMLS